MLLRELSGCATRHSYRFIIVPETIGALAYIASHEQAVRALTGGLVVATVAGPRRFGYKRTFRGDAVIDRAVRLNFRDLGLEFTEYPIDANGSDERQYSTPGLMPV